MANRWEKLGKQILFAPFHLRRQRPLVPFPAGRPPRRILLIRADDRIGNVILLTPLLDAIRRTWPGVTIDLLLARAGVELLAGDPRIDRRIIFDKRLLVKNPLTLLGLIGALRRERYDLVVDASHPQEFSLTGSLLTVTARSPRRIGFLAGPSGRVLDGTHAWDQDDGRHQSEHFLDLVRLVAPDLQGGPLHLPLLPEERAAGEAILARAGVTPGSVTIGIHPGGRGVKRWPLEKFVELIARLEAAPGRRVVLFQGPGEAELIGRIPPGRGLVIPPLPVRSFAAALAPLRLFISGDTGPMHLAAAVGTPTLSLFLVPNHAVFAPPGAAHRALYDPDGLTVDAVAREALAILSRPAGAPGFQGA